jgi:hypothetical protein
LGTRYGRGMRRAARRSSCPPTVTPIWASSPAAWTAVVTISVPLGRPSGCRAGCGFGGAFGPGTTRWTGLTFAAFTARFEGGAFAARFAGVAFAAGFDRLALAFAFAFVGGSLVARADARRDPPIGFGRVLRRLPSTLGSFVAFLLFFFADFWVTRSTPPCEFADFARERGTVNAGSGRRPL